MPERLYIPEVRAEVSHSRMDYIHLEKGVLGIRDALDEASKMLPSQKIFFRLHAGGRSLDFAEEVKGVSASFSNRVGPVLRINLLTYLLV